MSAAPIHLYLESYLAPLGEWLSREDVTDIYINRPGEIWVESLGGGVQRHDAPGLNRDALQRLARQIAALNAQGINRESPILSGNLPDGSRVQIVLPPATRGEIAIAVRRHVARDVSLESFRPKPSDQPVGTAGNQQDPSLDFAADPIAALRKAVRERRNILISGGTSSGKTTLLNALLSEVPNEERLIAIEDAAELQLHHPNCVGLIAARGGTGEASIGADDLLVAALRMRPDRIILGEIRGSEALTFLRAVNTGHPGSLTTIHADSPARAIDQLALLVLQAGSRLDWDSVTRYITNSIDIFVQMSSNRAKRQITSIFAPDIIRQHHESGINYSPI